jgi:hypothetical protein
MRVIAILTLVLLYGCAVQNEVHEDRMYVTRKYSGDFVKQEPWEMKRFILPNGKITKIYTTTHEFYLWGRPELEIPQGASCYVKYIPETIPGSMGKRWVLYFTWDGTEDLFMLAQDPYTGVIF